MNKNKSDLNVRAAHLSVFSRTLLGIHFCACLQLQTFRFSTFFDLVFFSDWHHQTAAAAFTLAQSRTSPFYFRSIPEPPKKITSLVGSWESLGNKKGSAERKQDGNWLQEGVFAHDERDKKGLGV